MTRTPLLLALLALSACAGQPAPTSAVAPGFLLGLWHGFIALFAFVGSLLDGSIRIYAFPNAGVSYDFGFMCGNLLWGLMWAGAEKANK